MNYITVVGINYKHTPVVLRSKVAIGSRQLEEALVFLHRYVSQGIILSTCNRIEIYALSSEKDGDGSLEFLAARSGLPKAILIPRIYRYEGLDAVKHLFRVASGLDSMIIGEYEILGQVKQAFQAAQKSGLVNRPLLELFRKASSCGRKARSRTGISQNAVSVSSVAVDLAVRAVNDLNSSRILVIGAGEAGRQASRVCSERGAAHITVASRSSHKGRAFAASIRGNWVPMHNLEPELIKNDIVICCSSAPHTILKPNMIERAMRLRSRKPLVIIDIGVPCNVDPEVKNIGQVSLFNIDELTAISRVNRQQRQAEIAKVENIVDAEAAKFMAFWHEWKVQPLIAALVNKAESIRQARLNLALKKSPALSVEERLNIETLSKSIVKKMLHEPIRCLKANHKDEEYFRIVDELFHLDNQHVLEEKK